MFYLFLDTDRAARRLQILADVFAPSSRCVGYMGYPFQKWTFLLFISAVSRSCGMHR